MPANSRSNSRYEPMKTQVKEFLSAEICVSDAARSQIDHLLGLSDIAELIVLPDVHYKKDSFPPKGIAALSRHTLYPFLLSKEIGCGIRALSSGLSAREMHAGRLDDFFSRFKSSRVSMLTIGDLILKTLILPPASSIRS